METLRITERQDGLHWSYDREGDVLYISVGQPRHAVGLDLGHGLVARYDEENGINGRTGAVVPPPPT